ncbi:hypothetical protein BpHYR1_000205 [Brachionus plicatilis]|uniref:Homeobox domain-containing protein n=1 Tax=Brachionus plicatilis TaxID=10195 RepID=A0A3M7SDA1_BRAPC|nr:hypothetical protein BpHYR1_000205 [Brachionus plicatilis]
MTCIKFCFKTHSSANFFHVSDIIKKRVKTWFQNRRMKHKKVSKKSVNSTTGKTGDQVSLSFDGHVSRKMKHSDELNSRSNSKSSRSRSNSQSMSNDSNVDCESSKSDEETSFNQSMYEFGKEKEEVLDGEPRVDNENQNVKKSVEFAFSNHGLGQLPVNFSHLLQSQQFKLLNQFYHEMRNGNSSLTNVANGNYLNQIGFSMTHKVTDSGK